MIHIINMAVQPETQPLSRCLASPGVADRLRRGYNISILVDHRNVRGVGAFNHCCDCPDLLISSIILLSNPFHRQIAQWNILQDACIADQIRALRRKLFGDHLRCRKVEEGGISRIGKGIAHADTVSFVENSPILGAPLFYGGDVLVLHNVQHFQQPVAAIGRRRNSDNVVTVIFSHDGIALHACIF